MARKKILIAEDSRTILMVEKMILREAYDLVTAKDGQEAVEMAEAERPDLILMDIIMPKMNGFEACRKLRGQDSTKDIPIIMVTTRGEPENVEMGFESGCSDYVTKPISSIELLSKLKDYLGD